MLYMVADQSHVNAKKVRVHDRICGYKHLKSLFAWLKIRRLLFLASVAKFTMVRIRRACFQ